MAKRESNARYYQATKDRIILRESELRPSTILELIDCLRDFEPHPIDRRIARLALLYEDLTGELPPRDEPSPSVVAEPPAELDESIGALDTITLSATDDVR